MSGRPIRIAIIGVTGRMGRALVRAARETEGATVAAGVGSSTSSELGKDVGELAGIGRCGVTVTSDLAAALSACDVAIDFSSASATSANIAACRAARVPLVIGTTGFSSATDLEIDAASHDIALLVAANTSLGVTLLIELVKVAAKVLPSDFDIEISEAHHRNKRDAPSGTALALGRAAAQARGQDLASVAATSRSGESPRRAGEIGFAVTRGGDIVGDHTVLFAGTGEQVILGHRASDRAIFARGALKAAAWLYGRPPRRYAMRDVLGYETGT